jgi:hypothetical protein
MKGYFIAISLFIAAINAVVIQDELQSDRKLPVTLALQRTKDNLNFLFYQPLPVLVINTSVHHVIMKQKFACIQIVVDA